MTKHLLLLVRFFRQFPLEKFEHALDLYISATEQSAASGGLPKEEDQPNAPVPALKDYYEEEELMTIKEAEAFIPAGRTKIYKWRKEGKLHTVSRGQRYMRLIRTEVEAMQLWAIDKGKR